MNLTHIVTAQEEGITLQKLLRDVLSLSARQTKIAKQQGAVTVDDAPFFANQPLRAGMTVRVSLAGYDQSDAPPQATLPTVRVLYEDEALLAVFKPALLQCHPSPSAPRGADTLEARVHQFLGYGAHPVHRLDAETTGIVLFAKFPFVQAHLQQQMQAGTFQKTYRAWCYGAPTPSSGTIDAPIARLHPDSFTRVIRADGQHAVSRYETLRMASLPNGGCATMLALSPITGRTHQLRVHMAHIGSPLLGDTRYFSPESRAASKALSLDYHQLSAVSLRFFHPATGQPMYITCDAEFAFSPD